jgi:hypothetical protein
MMMDSLEAANRRQWQREREAEGVVADSMDVRRALVARFDAGEITLPQMQEELARIKRGAKAKGQITRDQAWRGA